MIRMLQKARSWVTLALNRSVDPSVAQIRAVALSLMLFVSLVAVGGAMAQTTAYTEGWEDGNTNGYTITDNGASFAVNQDNPESGSYALEMTAIDQSTTTSGEITSDTDYSVSTDQEFAFQTHFQVNSDGNSRFRFGLTDGTEDMYLFWHPNQGPASTVEMRGSLIQDSQDLGSGPSDPMGAYNQTTIKHFPANDSVVVTMNDQFLLRANTTGAGFADNTSVHPFYGIGLSAQDGSDRIIYTDNSKLVTGSTNVDDGGGTTPTSTPSGTPQEPQLELDADRYMEHGSTQEYQVIYTDDQGQRSDVSDSATVTSNNTSVVTVDQTAHELIATSDTSINGTSEITAEYNGETVTKTVTVANATLDNAKILPGTWRATAMISDDTIFFLIIVAMIMGVIGRYATAFAGLGMGQLAVAIGWWGGYVPEGVAMVSVFLVLFVGFNLAVNIDYTVVR